jgi:hypothetical protein
MSVYQSSNAGQIFNNRFKNEKPNDHRKEHDGDDQEQQGADRFR